MRVPVYERQIGSRPLPTPAFSGATPSDTALACGFADQAHMTRQFKARTGLTPAVFRAG